MKKYFAVLVACVVLMCLNVEAQGEPKVTIYGAASGIPNSVVAEIVAENPDSQEITFLKWENAVLDNELVMPLAGWTYSDIVVKTGSTNVTLADKFIISVAKGAKTTLSKEFSATVSASVNLSSSGGQNTGKPSAGQLGNSVDRRKVQLLTHASIEHVLSAIKAHGRLLQYFKSIQQLDPKSMEHGHRLRSGQNIRLTRK